MADPSLPDEMLAGLRDIRLPEFAPGGIIAELAAALGLGVLIACALSLLFPLISRKLTTPEAGLDDHLRRISALPEEERRIAVLHLMRQRDGDLPAALRDRLYARDGFPSLAELEQILKAAPHA